MSIHLRARLCSLEKNLSQDRNFNANKSFGLSLCRYAVTLVMPPPLTACRLRLFAPCCYVIHLQDIHVILYYTRASESVQHTPPKPVITICVFYTVTHSDGGSSLHTYIHNGDVVHIGIWGHRDILLLFNVLLQYTMVRTEYSWKPYIFIALAIYSSSIHDLIWKGLSIHIMHNAYKTVHYAFQLYYAYII